MYTMMCTEYHAEGRIGIGVSVETRRSDDLYTGASPDGDGVEAERWPYTLLNRESPIFRALSARVSDVCFFIHQLSSTSDFRGFTVVEGYIFSSTF